MIKLLVIFAILWQNSCALSITKKVACPQHVEKQLLNETTDYEKHTYTCFEINNQLKVCKSDVYEDKECTNVSTNSAKPLTNSRKKRQSETQNTRGKNLPTVPITQDGLGRIVHLGSLYYWSHDFVNVNQNFWRPESLENALKTKNDATIFRHNCFTAKKLTQQSRK